MRTRLPAPAPSLRSSGYALLALNWPSHAFTAATSPQGAPPAAGGPKACEVVRHYIAGSVLRHLAQRGVEVGSGCLTWPVCARC